MDTINYTGWLSDFFCLKTLFPIYFWLDKSILMCTFSDFISTGEQSQLLIFDLQKWQPAKYIPDNFYFILIRSAIIRGVEQVENCSQRDIKSGDNLILQGMMCWPGNFRYDFIIQTWMSPETCFRTIWDDFHCQQLTLIKLFFLQASVLGN